MEMLCVLSANVLAILLFSCCLKTGRCFPLGDVGDCNPQKASSAFEIPQSLTSIQVRKEQKMQDSSCSGFFLLNFKTKPTDLEFSELSVRGHRQRHIQRRIDFSKIVSTGQSGSDLDRYCCDTGKLGSLSVLLHCQAPVILHSA